MSRTRTLTVLLADVMLAVILILLIQIDKLVNDTLYNYGLTFSTEWAQPYWLIIRISLVLTIVTILAISLMELYASGEIRHHIRKAMLLVRTGLKRAFHGLKRAFYRVKRAFHGPSKLLHRSKKTMLLIMAVATITIVVNSAIAMWLSRYGSLHVPSIGTIQTIDVEAYGGNVTLKDGVAYIDWGSIYPGASKNESFYLRSTSNVNVKINLETANWDPLGIASYMNVSWNYSGRLLRPNEVVPITLILNVSSSENFITYLIANDVKQFSFDISIYASEW